MTNFGNINPIDVLKGHGSPMPLSRMPGLHKGSFTGEFLAGDNQYPEINVNNVYFYARPCYGFGSMVTLPSADFLKQYKDEIFAWVMFEKENPKFCVLMGWCFSDGKQNMIENFPDGSYFRTVFYRQIFDDIQRVYGIYYTEKGSEQNFELKKTGLFSVVKDLLFTVTNTLKLKSKKHVVESDKILIGSEKATQAGVLGNELLTQLTEILTTDASIATQAAAIATSAATVATQIGNPAAATSLTTSATQLTTTAAKYPTLISKLKSILSNKILIE